MAVFLDQWEKSEYSSQTRSILAVSISFFSFYFVGLGMGYHRSIYVAFNIVRKHAGQYRKDKHETKEEDKRRFFLNYHLSIYSLENFLIKYTTILIIQREIDTKNIFF